MLDELVRAWREPGAWQTSTHVGGTDLPGGVAGAVVTNELVLRAWDPGRVDSDRHVLAVATGQPHEPDRASPEGSWRVVSGTPDDPAARRSLFGPVVAVPEDAPLLDRVLGAAGRDPRWSPPA